MELLWSVLVELLTPQNGWSLHLVVRVLLSTVLLFTYIVMLARTFGSRTFATFTSFDFLTNVAAGSLVASGILGRSIIESSLSLLTLVLLQWLVSALGARSSAVQAMVDNPPVLLIHNGVLLEAALRQARVSHATLDQQLRSAGVLDLKQVHFAVLESGGTISVLSGEPDSERDAAALAVASPLQQAGR